MAKHLSDALHFHLSGTLNSSAKERTSPSECGRNSGIIPLGCGDDMRFGGRCARFVLDTRRQENVSAKNHGVNWPFSFAETGFSG